MDIVLGQIISNFTVEELNRLGDHNDRRTLAGYDRLDYESVVLGPP